MISIKGLAALSGALRRLDTDAAPRAALELAAQRLAGAVADALSHAPGSDHATPWRRTGALHDSIGWSTDADSAVVGSSSSVAVDQELGTAAIPPRSFLASTAAAHAPELAQSIGDATALAIRQALAEAK